MLNVKHCVICEDVRVETRNLNSLMGVYGLLPDVAIAVKDLREVVNFVTVFYGAPISGVFNLSAELRTNAGMPLVGVTVLPSAIKFVGSDAWISSVFLFRFSVVFPVMGRYRVAVLADRNVIYQESFQVLPVPQGAFEKRA